MAWNANFGRAGEGGGQLKHRPDPPDAGGQDAARDRFDLRRTCALGVFPSAGLRDCTT